MIATLSCYNLDSWPGFCINKRQKALSVLFIFLLNWQDLKKPIPELTCIKIILVKSLAILYDTAPPDLI